MITRVHSLVRMKWVPTITWHSSLWGSFFFFEGQSMHISRDILYCTIWMHRNLPTVNVNMLSQDSAMIGARIPITGNAHWILSLALWPYRLPWPRLFEIINTDKLLSIRQHWSPQIGRVPMTPILTSIYEHDAWSSLASLTYLRTFTLKSWKMFRSFSIADVSRQPLTLTRLRLRIHFISEPTSSRTAHINVSTTFLLRLGIELRKPELQTNSD